MIKWIIQENLIRKETLNEIVNALIELDIEYETVKIIPFSDKLPEFEPREINIFYGSTTLMLNAYNSERFNNGVFFNDELFTLKNYLDKWDNCMLNNKGKVLKFKDFIELEVNNKDEWFIRPNSDTKSFTGAVLTSKEIQDWYNKILTIDSPDINSESLIFVSEKKSITKEWRNFIVNGRVVDSSRYVLNGNLEISREDIPKKMIEFVENCSKKYSPNDIFVMDIAEINDEYKIIESNCFNGTGFYNHNIKKIIKSITERLMEKEK